METNKEGLELIKSFESLILGPYKDPVGVVTIGYGHVVLPGEVFHHPFTKADALEVLKKDLKIAENSVKSQVKIAVNDNEFSALVSLVFNIGEGNFLKSSVLRRLNAGDRAGAANAFQLWNKARDRKTGIIRILPGLTRRRKAERELFLKKSDLEASEMIIESPDGSESDPDLKTSPGADTGQIDANTKLSILTKMKDMGLQAKDAYKGADESFKSLFARILQFAWGIVLSAIAYIQTNPIKIGVVIFLVLVGIFIINSYCTRQNLKSIAKIKNGKG